MCRRCYYREYDRTPKRRAYKHSYNISEPRREYARQFSKTERFRTNMKRYQATEKFTKNIDKYQTSIKGRFKAGIAQAKRRNQIWTIDFESYQQMIGHYCKGALSLKGHGLDRKNNNLNYSIDNVVACCGGCNRTKGDRLSYEEIVAISELLLKMRAK